MNADEIVRALRESLPPKIDYAELVGAEGFAHGACYVWDDPLPYLMSDAADLLESQQARIAELEAQLAASQRRERAAVEDLEWLMLRGDSADCCTLCEHDHTHNGPCAGQSTKCEPKWRGPQQAGKGAAHKPGGEQDG